MQYDWTYTTGYAGTYEGHEASSSFPEFCKVSAEADYCSKGHCDGCV